MLAPSSTPCCVGSELVTKLRNPRGASVKDQLSLFETPTRPGAAPVWSTLDVEQRALVVSTLVRLVAKAVAAPGEPVADEEKNHE